MRVNRAVAVLIMVGVAAPEGAARSSSMSLVEPADSLPDTPVPAVVQVAAPPLQRTFADDFSTDSRADYNVRGDLTWRPGRLTLKEGASLERNLNGSAWLTLDLALLLPELTDEVRAAELRIWFRLEGGTDCYLRLQQTAAANKSMTSAVLVDTGEQDGMPFEQVVREVGSIELSSGKVSVEYRYGLVRVLQHERVLFSGCINNGGATVRAMGLETDQAAYVLTQVAASSVARTARARLLRQQEELVEADAELSRLYREGQLAEAIKLGTRILSIRASVFGDRHPEYATSLNNLAFFYTTSGDYAGAEPLYQEALQIQESALGEQHPFYATSLNNLATLYDNMGDYAQAEPLYRQALAIKESTLGVEHPSYGSTLNNLAVLYFGMGDYARAEPLYRQAMDVTSSVLGEEHPRYATSLNNLATLYRSMENNERAERLYRQALEIRRKVLGELHPDYARSLNNLATLYDDIGDHTRAEPLYLAALKVQEAVLGEQHPDYATSLDNLAGLYGMIGDRARAERFSTRAVDLVRDNLDRNSFVQSQRQQKNNQSVWRPVLDSRINLAVRFDRGSDDVARMIWDWKGAITARQRAYRQIASDERLHPLFEELQTVARQLSAGSNQVPIPPVQSADVSEHEAFRREQQGWKQRILRLTRQREALEQRIASASEEFRQIREPLTVDVVKSRLPESTAFVDFLEYRSQAAGPEGKVGRFERRYVALVIRPDRVVELVGLGATDVLGEQIAAFRRQFSGGQSGSPEASQAATRLRNTLWLPLEKHLDGIFTVIISPDTVLGTLPFGALPGAKQDSYLIEQFRFVSLPLAGMLRSPDETPSRTQPEKGLLVLGDVAYDANAEETPAAETTGSRPAWMRRSAPRSDERGWTSLPGFEDELVLVRERFEKKFGDSVTTLRGAEATEAEFIRHASRHYNLHIVTHGFFAKPQHQVIGAGASFDREFDPLQRTRLGRNPTINQYVPGLLSGLVLAGANNPPPDDNPNADGILTATEIETLDLNGVDLVVLSACDTGLGKTAGGEGLTGLQRAFQIAGARSVVASLWEVPDRATQELMSRFYRYYWGAGRSKIDALRQAQLDLLNDRDLVRGLGGVTGKPRDRRQSVTPDRPKNAGRTDPRYWAAFVLSGDWR